MKKYKIGVVGAGARGEFFARSLYAGTKRTELFGVCDHDEDRLEKFCNYCEINDTKKFTDTAAFVREPDLDAIIITVPEFAHADVAVAAMQAGKHVYLEKPLAHTVEDCHRIIECNRATDTVAYVGFNLRAGQEVQKAKEIMQSGVLGQITHISGLEQLHYAHGAAFMRRFHRKHSQSGGLLNHKCCHDMDLMLWAIGHEHKVVKISSFGGTNVLTTDKQMAEHCSECSIVETCPYAARPGYAFPCGRSTPFYHRDSAIYGGDLCVYNADRDIVDNQVVIMEFDNGIRGDFRLEMFQASGRRRQVIWGENGMLERDSDRTPSQVLTTRDGDATSYTFAPRSGGHGGVDSSMIGRFVSAIDSGGKEMNDSGLEAGLAVSIVAIKADEARLSGQVVEIDPVLYM